MATWSKVKQQLESFLCDSLKGRVEYCNTCYRYTEDRSGKSYMMVDKEEVFKMVDQKYGIRWYQTKEEVMKEPDLNLYVSMEEIDAMDQKNQGKIPRDRLRVMIAKTKLSEYAKSLIEEQNILSKQDFYDGVNAFLSNSIDDSLQSPHILPNILAIIDRRVGKNKLRKMQDVMKLKHPIVQYFYELRCNS